MHGLLQDFFELHDLLCIEDALCYATAPRGITSNLGAVRETSIRVGPDALLNHPCVRSRGANNASGSTSRRPSSIGLPSCLFLDEPMQKTYLSPKKATA